MGRCELRNAPLRVCPESSWDSAFATFRCACWHFPLSGETASNQFIRRSASESPSHRTIPERSRYLAFALAAVASKGFSRRGAGVAAGSTAVVSAGGPWTDRASGGLVGSLDRLLISDLGSNSSKIDLQELRVAVVLRDWSILTEEVTSDIRILTSSRLSSIR